MLNLSLSAVARSPVRIRVAVPTDHQLWDDAALGLAEPLRLDLEARSVGEGILVRGELETTLTAGCRRCLVPVEVAVRDNVDILYEPLTAEEETDLSGEVYPLPERGDQLDLGPAIREQLLLKVPEFVVCAETCQGLCPQCGAELNRVKCGCVPEAEASPWSALKDIKFD